MSEHKKTVTAIAWHPQNQDVFASSSAEDKIIIWDVVKQTTVAVRENLKGTPVTIGWNTFYTESVSYVYGRGPIFLWTYLGSSLTMSTVKETSSFSSDVTCFKWHTKKTEKVVLGHKDGSISICVVGKCNGPHKRDTVFKRGVLLIALDKALFSNTKVLIFLLISP